MEYCEHAELMTKERNKLQKLWRMFEQAYATTTPALEAEYAHDERTALTLYDSLIPRLREYRRLKLQPEIHKKDLVQDLKTQERIL